MKITRAFAFKVLMCCVVATVPAWAHAILLSATPAANAVIRDGRIHVLLQFNSRVDGKRSQLTLVSLKGQTRVPLEPQTSPDKLTAVERPLERGKYRLVWQVLAADGHLTRGQIPFQVQ